MLNDEMLERFVMMNANAKYTLVLDVVKWPCFVIFPYSFASTINLLQQFAFAHQNVKMFRAKKKKNAAPFRRSYKFYDGNC